MSFRRFVFTINNYTPEDIALVRALHPDTAKYIIFGRETAPTTNTPHLQGFLSLHDKKRTNAVRRLLPRAHIEIARGTNAQCVAYCQKEGNYEELGELQQGQRTDLDAARTMAALDGMRAVTQSQSYQGIRTAAAYLTYNEPERDPSVPITVIWCHGASGSGKTSWIWDQVAGKDVYWFSPDKDVWWDGYDAHDIIVLDDVRGSTFPFTYFLRLLDRYPMRIANKGGFRQKRCNTIYVSSIMPPQFLYNNLQNEPVQQIIRRITEIIEFPTPPVPEVSVPEVEGNTEPPLPRSEGEIPPPASAGYPPSLIRDRDWVPMSSAYTPVVSVWPTIHDAMDVVDLTED